MTAPRRRRAQRRVKRYSFRDYFFSYSWKELDRLHNLRDAWVVFYASFGLLGLLIDPFADRATSTFVLGGMACYPGFKLGIFLLKSEDPEIFEREHLVIWQLGNLANFMSAMAIAVLIDNIVWW